MRKRVRLVSFASFLTLFAMLLAACGGPTTTGGSGTPAPTTAKAAVTVGIVTDVGGLNDGGFNQFSHAGYEKARAQYGFPDVVIQSQVISDAEYTKNITAPRRGVLDAERGLHGCQGVPQQEVRLD